MGVKSYELSSSKSDQQRRISRQKEKGQPLGVCGLRHSLSRSKRHCKTSLQIIVGFLFRLLCNEAAQIR